MIFRYFQSIGDGTPFINLGVDGGFIQLTIYANSNPVFRAAASDGQIINFQQNGSFSFAGAAANSIAVYSSKAAEIYQFNISGNSTGTSVIGGVNTLDVSALTGLNSSVMFGLNIQKYIGRWTGQLLARNNSLGGVVDFSQAACGEMDAVGIGATGFVWPLPDLLYSINVGNNRISTPVVLPAYPLLRAFDMQYQGGRIVPSVDLSACPALQSVALANTYANTVLLHPLAYQQLQVVNLYTCRVTGRAVFGGNFADLVPAFSAARNLYSLDLRGNGLTEAEVEGLINGLHANRAARVAAGLYLDEQTVGLQYPSILYNVVANAPVVSGAALAKITELRNAYGWTIAHNWPVFSVERVDSTTTRISYGGDAGVSLWAVGDTINAPEAIGALPAGNYTVTGGAGKVWEIAFEFASINPDFGVFRPL